MQKFFVLFIIFVWIFSGWPPIWNNPRVPSEIPKTQAATTPTFEAGEVTISDSLNWTSITLSGTYASAPVIIATPVTAVNCEAQGSCAGNSTGGGGGMYPIPIVRNVTTTGFDISMCVDGGNTACSTGVSAETFHWFAFDVDDAANYDWIEVGTTTNVDVSGGNTSGTFTTSFATAPVVWTQAQTYSQSGNIGAVAWVNDTVTTSAFTYIGCTHQGTGNSCTGGTNETFGYVAIDTTNEAFDATSNFQSGMVDISNSQWAGGTFSPGYTNPRVMVTQNDDDGGEDPQYAWVRNVTNSGMDFRYCEEDSGTTCNTHTSEKTYWFALEEPVEGTSQLHFRWRDDTTVLNTSGGWLAAEDSNSIGDITKNSTYRVRIESAAIRAESAARTYELQWGDKTGQSSCSGISTWTGIADASDKFDMVDTTNISPDGESTSPALLANSEGYTYTTGEGRDVADTTGSIGPMSANYYTELEYSFKATDDAVTGHTYCFRLYDTTAGAALDSYSVYPETTISSVAILTTIGEYGTVVLTGNTPSTVNLADTYTNLVVVASARYAPTTDPQRAPRIIAKTSTSFDIKVDNYAGSLTGNTTVDWIAMEAGSYTISDGGSGTKVIAGTENTNGTYCGTDAQSGTPNVVTFSPNFNGAPAVITTVASNNDTAWAVTHVDDNTLYDNEPTASTMRVMLNVSFNSCTTPHGAEDIDYIAFDTGHGTNNSVDFDATIGVNTVSCCNTTGYATNFSSSFSTAPEVYVIAQMGEDGGNGGYAVTHTGTAVSASTHYGSIDEDGPSADRSHTDENVAIIAFDSSSDSIVSNSTALDQTTFRFYDNTDSIQPGTAKAAENTAITEVANSDIVRIRTALQAGIDNLNTSAVAFKLQYGQGSMCSSIGTWTDVDSAGGAGIWRGYNNTTPADGTQITSSLLNFQTNALESYEEQNNSAVNPAAISKGSRGEWDWVVQNNGASGSTDYCFRTVLSDGSVIQYTNYPKLTTAAAGALSVDIVDTGGSSVPSPSMAMAAISAAIASQQSTGVFGISDQKIRVSNSMANQLWTLTVAASSTGAFWDGASADYDFNDGSGAVDGSDADSMGGQMTIDAATNGVITPQTGCSSAGLTLGSSASFDEGATDTITLLTAGVAAEISCYWDLTGVDISQVIPAEQPADSYSIDMVLTITAN